MQRGQLPIPQAEIQHQPFWKTPAYPHILFVLCSLGPDTLIITAICAKLILSPKTKCFISSKKLAEHVAGVRTRECAVYLAFSPLLSFYLTEAENFSSSFLPFHDTSTSACQRDYLKAMTKKKKRKLMHSKESEESSKLFNGWQVQTQDLEV